MKTNKTKLYAKALAEVLGKKHTRQNAGAFGAEGASADEIVRNFIKFLQKNGQMGRAKEILGLAEDFLLAKQGKRKITFEIARRMTADNRALLKGFAKEGDVVKEKINHELIAGVKIIINNNRQFDASMLSKLQNIF